MIIDAYLIQRIFTKRTRSCPPFKMLWQPFVSLVAFIFKPFHAPPTPLNDIYYNATRVGPQSWREAHDAMKALQGHGDDMRYHEDWPESAGIKDERFRWPGFPGKAEVAYVIHPSARNMKDMIEKSIEQYHDKTCVRFVPRTNQRHYVNIIADRGCYSYVGLQSRGAQPLSLGRGCGYIGTIVHELGHAIGLYHEHQRSDRDDHLIVHMNNVISSQRHNFDKTAKEKEVTFDHDYDYTSIMHYGPFAFSVVPMQKKTMEAKDGTQLKEPYEKEGLNDQDVELVKKLYQC